MFEGKAYDKTIVKARNVRFTPRSAFPVPDYAVLGPRVGLPQRCFRAIESSSNRNAKRLVPGLSDRPIECVKCKSLIEYSLSHFMVRATRPMPFRGLGRRFDRLSKRQVHAVGQSGMKPLLSKWPCESLRTGPETVDSPAGGGR